MRGFTLLEIIITVGIIALLLSLVLVSFYFLKGRVDLQKIAEDMLGILRLARSKTLASEASSNYGVRLEQSRYILFRGTAYVSGALDNVVYNVSPGIEIYNDSLLGWPDIIFQKITGAVDSSKTGKFGVRLTANPSEKTTINVKSSGEITVISQEISLGGTRITDSRHIHFSYSRIITIATENLVLTFSNPPDPDVIENIPMKDYTSGGKFDWQGKVTVGGEDQVLRVHTHILNDAVLGTTFSINRDRRYNTKALTITIGDIGDPPDELIKYTAAGQESKGTSLNVGNPARQ